MRVSHVLMGAATLFQDGSSDCLTVCSPVCLSQTLPFPLSLSLSGRQLVCQILQSRNWCHLKLPYKFKESHATQSRLTCFHYFLQKHSSLYVNHKFVIQSTSVTGSVDSELCWIQACEFLLGLPRVQVLRMNKFSYFHVNTLTRISGFVV